MALAALPINAILPELLRGLRMAGAAVLRAPTGAGKTTRVPPAILDSGLADLADLTGRDAVIVLQPRRLAARACARRMAQERGGRLGDEVGYHVRFDRCLGPQTRIHVVTEGILLRRLQDDPFLEGVAAVVFDEFHERSLSSDLALAMVRRVRQTVRPELKLVVMSATLDGEPIARYLGGCPVVECTGRLHPVAITHVEGLESMPLVDRAVEGVARALKQNDGDVLVFLPGVGEIRQTARRLESLSAANNLAVMPLYGDLPAEKQDEVLAPINRRKVVLATNVAETSITIEGITCVVDTGVARRPAFDPHLGMDRLALTAISQASADQRAGRAGRTRPGVCLRLWPARTHHRRPEHDEPEIRRLDLAGPVLQLRAWGEGDLRAFPWFEPPNETALDQAETLLRRLDALDRQGRITQLGYVMARLPVSPRLARMLVEGQRRGQSKAVALAAAILSERDPFGPDEGQSPMRRAGPPPSDSDVLDRVIALDDYERSGRADTPLGSIRRAAARFVFHVRDQLLRELGPGSRVPLLRQKQCGPPPDTASAEAVAHAAADEAVLLSLLAAFPDRLARRTSPGSQFGRMVGGRGVRLAAASAVREAPLFLAVEADLGESEALVWKASAVRREWLPAAHLAVRTEVDFDKESQRVAARRRVYWEDLLLEESPEALGDTDEAARILAKAAAESLDAVFPADDAATVEFRNRVRCLAGWMPELELPNLDDDGLRALLPTVALGCRSFADLRRGSWLGAMRGLLTAQQAAAVEREAPARIVVPSGSAIRLQYEPGKPPVLAVRIQEVFGLMETPRVARGRVAVLLHLLAPNMRVEQVTEDLASFWRSTYHQVRKDLRRRYPKHAWPEDPLQAVAERRPQRKRRP